MLDSFLLVPKMFFELLKYPLYAICILLAIFVACCAFWFVRGLIDGKRLKKGSRQIVKKESFIKRLFYKLPKMYVDDIFERDPDFFRYQGCIIFEGRQGAGKNIYRRIQKNYTKKNIYRRTIQKKIFMTQIITMV